MPTFICNLSKKEKQLLSNNPHCIMWFCEPDRISNKKTMNHKFTYSRIFNETSFLDRSNLSKPELHNFFRNDNILKTFSDFKKHTKNVDKKELVYLPRGQRPLTTLHLGQLKLFLSTFQFLLKYAPPNKEVNVVYPGSAPGYNIEFLTKLFPQCKWYLFDPNSFCKTLENNSNIVCSKQCLFTDDECREVSRKLKNKYTLLISDIRVEPTSESIANDQSLQLSWVKLLKPDYAQLKFRPPRMQSNYMYLDGEVYFQMYAPQSSTETRLVVNGKQLKMKTYNIKDYDGIMYYFNRVLRCSFYKSPYKIHCTDHCHDCVAMIALIKNYRKKYSNSKNKWCKKFVEQSVPDIVNEIFEKIQNVKKRICTHFFDTVKMLE